MIWQEYLLAKAIKSFYSNKDYKVQRILSKPQSKTISYPKGLIAQIWWILGIR